jgi:hypothetical protein
MVNAKKVKIASIVVSIASLAYSIYRFFLGSLFILVLMHGEPP